MRKIIALFIVLISLSSSCEKGTDGGTAILVYKTKADYSKNVPVMLSNDKSKIIAAPGALFTGWPVLLRDNYFLNGSLGVNSAYLSVTIEAYNNHEVDWSLDSLYKYIIDKDPFIEFYQRNDDNGFYDKNGAFGIDTTLINELIYEGKLEK